MARLTKDEFNTRIDSLELSDEVKVSLMEDVADSIVDNSAEYNELNSKYDELTNKYNDLSTRYKERFLESNSSVPNTYEPKAELQEKNYIDIKSI